MIEDFEQEIGQGNGKYPMCIVWTPIPCLTWIFPFIGHIGITDSNGLIYDFAGDCHINVYYANLCGY